MKPEELFETLKEEYICITQDKDGQNVVWTFAPNKLKSEWESNKMTGVKDGEYYEYLPSCISLDWGKKDWEKRIVFRGGYEKNKGNRKKQNGKKIVGEKK